jgi:RNA polymerase sigma factor (sigma-70 family)
MGLSSRTAISDVDKAMNIPDRPAEFDDLFDRLYAPAVRLADRVVGSADAEDVAVEAFARALARWEKVRRLSYLDAWVLRVTANLALDRLRHERRPLTVATAVAPIAPEDAAALRVTMQEALRSLPRRQGQVLSLRYMAGLKEEEVAGALGISLGSVKTHARRGLAAMRVALGHNREELFDAR